MAQDGECKVAFSEMKTEAKGKRLQYSHCDSTEILNSQVFTWTTLTPTW